MPTDLKKCIHKCVKELTSQSPLGFWVSAAPQIVLLYTWSPSIFTCFVSWMSTIKWVHKAHHAWSLLSSDGDQAGLAVVGSRQAWIPASTLWVFFPSLLLYVVSLIVHYSYRSHVFGVIYWTLHYHFLQSGLPTELRWREAQPLGLYIFLQRSRLPEVPLYLLSEDVGLSSLNAKVKETLEVLHEYSFFDSTSICKFQALCTCVHTFLMSGMEELSWQSRNYGSYPFSSGPHPMFIVIPRFWIPLKLSTTTTCKGCTGIA